MKYQIAKMNGTKHITVWHKDEVLVATESSHPDTFDEIQKGVLTDDENVIRLFSPGHAFEQLSERVVMRFNDIYFDGDKIDNALTKHIVDLVREDKPVVPTINFFEKLYQNPNDNSRAHLYSHIDKHGLELAIDGDFFAYKGCEEDLNGALTSSKSGTATVNGENVSGVIPQPIGGIVEMPRSEVKFDPNVACATGLHVGSRSYADSFPRTATPTLKVKVNPRDVVSVPKDHNESKVRVRRYKIVEKV